MRLAVNLGNVLKQHATLLLPVLGAASLFITNFLLKAQLNPTDYGHFAAMLLIVSTMFMLGGVGVEQVIVRKTQLNNSILVVGRELVVLCILSLVFAPFVYLGVLLAFGVIAEPTLESYAMGLVIALATNVTAYMKVNGQLTSLYALLHSWKFALLLLAICNLYVYQLVSFTAVVVISVLTATMASLFAFRLKRIKVDWSSSFKGSSSFMVAGFISVVGVGVYDGFDRYVVKSLFDIEQFGEYFFLMMAVFSPVAIISSYFANRRLAAYKKHLKREEFLKDFAKSAGISAVVAVMAVIGIGILMFAGFLEVNLSISMVLTVLVLAVIRGTYMHVSMAIALVCSSRALILTSLAFLLVAGVLFFSLNAFIPHMLVVVWSVVLLWILRTGVYFFMIHKRLNNELRGECNG